MAELYAGTSGWSYPSLAAGLLPGRARERGLPRLLCGAAAVGRAELDRVPAAVRGAVRALGGAGAGRVQVRGQGAAARAAVTSPPSRSGCGLLGDPLGPVRVVVETPRDDGLLALLLGSTEAAARARPPRRELGRRRRRARGARERLGGGRAVPLPPLPRAAVLGARSSRRSPARIRPLLAAGVDVFAYFRHEEEPTAPAYAARLLELVRAEDG